MRRAALVIASLAMLGAGPAAARGRPEWVQPTAPFRVIGNVWYVGSSGISAWLIRTRSGAILLDAGMPEYAPQLEANIRKLGVRLTDVKLILNTHAHFDHSGGFARLKRDTGAKLVARTGDREALERGVYVGSEGDHSLDAPPVKVDATIRDGDTVELGGTKLVALATPGHTTGCTSWLMTVGEGGQAHRAIFFCSASVAVNRLAPNPQYPGIIADYRKTFARLATIKADVFLAPHAEQFDLAAKRAAVAPGKPNPFVVPGELQHETAAYAAAFEKALAEQQRKTP